MEVPAAFLTVILFLWRSKKIWTIFFQRLLSFENGFGKLFNVASWYGMAKMLIFSC